MPFPDNALMEIAGYPISWERADLPIGCFFAPGIDQSVIAAYRVVAVELNHLINRDLVDLGSRWELGELPAKTPRGYFTLESFIPIPNTVGETIYGHVGHTVLKGRILSARVKIRATLQADHLLTIMRHELGHVLGLAHDDNRHSIMSGTIGTNPPADVSFTAHDIALLQKLYG